jgi:hypothetical protein
MGSAMEDLTTVYTTFVIDLPLSGLKWSLGLAEEKETTETAWNAYDASVRLATSTIDRLYRTPLFGDAMAHSLELFLQGQRFSSALSGAMFTNLWNTVGLPLASETQALRAEVQTLREEVRTMNIPFAVRPKTKTSNDREDHTNGKAQTKITKPATDHVIRAAA